MGDLSIDNDKILLEAAEKYDEFEKTVNRLSKLKSKSKSSIEVGKIDYRANILLKSITRYKNQLLYLTQENCLNSNMEIKENLVKLFEIAIHRAFDDIPPFSIDVTLGTKFADYQCNSAMRLTKILKDKGIKMSPKEIAETIILHVPENECIGNVEVSGIGFINIFVKKEYVVNYLGYVLQHGTIPSPAQSSQKKLKVIVDFSSPNIAKEMHVGHLRSTIIGDSICRLLEYLGHDVIRLNHIGDWGTQFGMLIAHLTEQKSTVNAYDIESLQKLYKESKIRFDSDTDFKKLAYSYVVKLQSFDPETYKIWQQICQVSRTEFEKIYSRLGIRLQERGESFYQKLMESLVKDLTNSNNLIEDEGRKILWSGKDKVPLTIIKSDGGFTYDTSDLAALRHRVEVEKADWIIYVTDLGQGSHFEILFNSAEKLGFVNRDEVRLDHVGFGVVLGEDKKKFKTRSGDTVKLSDLLDEGLKRALDTLKAKDRHLVLSETELIAAQEAVAYGCIKYSDLCSNRNNEYVFSFDKMLQDKGNTAVYLLYAYTRIKSIARNAGITPEKMSDIVANECLQLDHEKEWKLAKSLIKFAEVIQQINQDLFLHHLCEYLYELATSFSEFYDHCYCVEKNDLAIVVRIHYSRILLCEVTSIFMRQCFDILGLKFVEKM